MKAIYYEQTGEAKKVLKSGTFDDPQVKKDEVVLEILYSSVNPADTKQRSGWISKKLNQPINTIKIKIFRAKKILNRLIED